MQPDTVVPEPGNPQAFNRCPYVGGNPLRFVDPTGHDPQFTLIDGLIGPSLYRPPLGHAFAQRAGRQPYRDLNNAQVFYLDTRGQPVIVAGGGWPNLGYQRTDQGYAGPFPGWQQSSVQTANEDFADMFLGWSYNHFANNLAGDARNRWMNTNMPRWIALAIAGD